MISFAEEFKIRTKKFALSIIKLSKALPRTEEAKIIRNQLMRSAFSVASNYRAVCRARSNAEFFSKLSIVVEEADECVFWMELLLEADILTNNELKNNLNEANEILAIVSKSRKTMKERNLRNQ